VSRAKDFSKHRHRVENSTVLYQNTKAIQGSSKGARGLSVPLFSLGIFT